MLYHNKFYYKEFNTLLKLSLCILQIDYNQKFNFLSIILKQFNILLHVRQLKKFKSKVSLYNLNIIMN
jgi:hypothetical protein